MWVENEAPTKETLGDEVSVSGGITYAVSAVVLHVKTHASRTTPILRVVAVPKRPIHQVASGDTNMAFPATVSKNIMAARSGRGGLHIEMDKPPTKAKPSADAPLMVPDRK